MIALNTKILERLNKSKEEGDSAYFLDLMFVGEQLEKIVATSLVAALNDDTLRHRYSQMYKLVRADGIGEWAMVIDEVLIGPSSQFFNSGFNFLQRELTERVSEGTWQFESLKLMYDCLKIVDEKLEDFPTKVSGRTWFSYFANLRNKTRGHGAQTTNIHSKLCSPLLNSIMKIIENYSLFTKVEWAYLHRNYSGKYNVIDLSTLTGSFHFLRKEKTLSFDNGVYIYLNKPIRIDLIYSNADTLDFYFPNGGFRNSKFEVISYISGRKEYQDADTFLTPPGELPSSETEGRGKLELVGNVFTNLPKLQSDYIKRLSLEKELKHVLISDRWPTITLVGRGGIGKTSLAISVLNELCYETMFETIIWFSARDIDLLMEGAKPVKPNILDEDDIAKEYVKLVEPNEAKNKGFKAKDFFQKELRRGSSGATLFIFDNFETVTSPIDLFHWLDSQIRLPNKILITSRFREFKADYPIEVKGMTEDEFNKLVISTARMLKIEDIVAKGTLIEDLYNESDGHPYIAKILLGEYAKEGAKGSFKRLVGNKEELLLALFERTYKSLSPSAKRVFLTLCSWRTIIPQIAIEAVLARNIDHIEAESAIEELHRSSLIESITVEKDNVKFISVPLSASIFGLKKLSVSSYKAAIDADTKLLQAFGVGNQSETKLGVEPRIIRFFNDVAKRVQLDKEKIEIYIPTLEFISNKYPKAWFQLSELYIEKGLEENAIQSLQNYLENTEDVYRKFKAWNRLADLYNKKGDWNAENHALVEICELSITSIETMYNSVCRINQLFKEKKFNTDTYEKEELVSRLIAVYRGKLNQEKDDALADYYSALAWLYLHVNDTKNAKIAVEIGLSIDSNNFHCLKLKKEIRG